MRKEEEEAVSNLPTKGQSFGDTNSVSSEVFADTGSLGLDKGLGPLGCLGGFRLDRGLELWGSFNTFTIVTTNLCNSNMFRNENFRDVSLGDPNNQREDWWAISTECGDWTVGEERSFWGNERTWGWTCCTRSGVDVMGYNISPLLFFIEICNNDEGNKKEYFGFFSKEDSTAVLDGCGEPQMDSVGREDQEKFSGHVGLAFGWRSRRRRQT